MVLSFVFAIFQSAATQSDNRVLPERLEECGWLQGNPFGPVTEAIPYCSEPMTVADQQTYTTDNPNLPGFPISYSILGLIFKLETTLLEADKILKDMNAEIISGIPGRSGEVEGLLQLRVPLSNQKEMNALVDALRKNLHIKIAVQDSFLSP
jgi:hypothetical protein